MNKCEIDDQLAEYFAYKTTGLFFNGTKHSAWPFN